MKFGRLERDGTCRMVMYSKIKYQRILNFAIWFMLPFWCFLTMAGADGSKTEPQCLSIVPADMLQQEVDEVRKLVSQPLATSKSKFEVPRSRAVITVEPLFSSQRGSWPFEPFVHGGLFRAIANYQTTHPRAVVIRDGSITLEQLYQQLNDNKILQRYKRGYLLYYPVLIEPGAALVVKNTSLYLYASSGTLLINCGTLNINDALLESKKNNDPIRNADFSYRPFIVSWAGSNMWIRSSTINFLGYNANLARGITAARHAHQDTSVPPAKILIHGNKFNGLSSGLELHNAVGQVDDNSFVNLQQYGLDINDCRVVVTGNRIDHVRNHSSIRTRGTSSIILHGNYFFHANKAGIEVADWKGVLSVQKNVIGAMQGNGIQLHNVLPDKKTYLLIAENVIGNSQRTAIEANDVFGAYVINNKIFNTPEYAISVRNAKPLSGKWVLTGNTLGTVGKAIVRVGGVEKMVIGNNQYEGNPLLQPLLMGDFSNLQSHIFDATIRQSCIVQVERDRGAPGK